MPAFNTSPLQAIYLTTGSIVSIAPVAKPALNKTKPAVPKTPKLRLIFNKPLSVTISFFLKIGLL